MSTLVPVVLLAAAAALAFPPRPMVPTTGPQTLPTPGVAESALVRHRLPVTALAALAGLTLLDGTLGVLVGVGLAVTVWITLRRMEPASVRAERESVTRELPGVIQLLAMVLASGTALPDSLRQVARAMPGPSTAALRDAEGRLAVGVAPEQVWAELARQPGFEQVGRVLGRAQVTGVPVADVVRRLGADLAREARADAEDRARAVGVRAAVPLGLCLLPAFLLVGIVPVVAASLRAVAW